MALEGLRAGRVKPGRGSDRASDRVSSNDRPGNMGFNVRTVKRADFGKPPRVNLRDRLRGYQRDLVMLTALTAASFIAGAITF